MAVTSGADAMAFETQTAMAEFLYSNNLTSPIVVERIADPRLRGTGDAEIAGTGSYFRYRGATYLLTAKHVADRAAEGLLQQLPVRDGRYAMLDGPFMGVDFQIDLAVARVSAPCSLPPAALDERFCPVNDELLFLLGYPGSTARRTEVISPANQRRPFADTFAVEAMPYTCRESALSEFPADFDRRFHVAIEYPANAQRELGGSYHEPPRPDGLSGSLLWDTKRVRAALLGEHWDPSLATVCGIVHHDYDRSMFLSATRIEYVRESLLRLIRHERAYLRWLDRGQPRDDAFSDWAWSEHTFAELDHP
jgi:hypothetical protein